MILDELKERFDKISSDEKILREFDKPENSDIYLGDISEVQRKLYILLEQYQNESRLIKSTGLKLQAQILNEERDVEKARIKEDQEMLPLEMSLSILSEKEDIANLLFWVDVHEAMDHLRPQDTKGIKICYGNKIYSYNKKTKPKIPDFLKNLLPDFENEE